LNYCFLAGGFVSDAKAKGTTNSWFGLQLFEESK
jgi:hypothetical protein